MSTPARTVTESLHAEIEQTPEQHRPMLLRLVHSFRESIASDAGQDALRHEEWFAAEVNKGRAALAAGQVSLLDDVMVRLKARASAIQDAASR